MGIEPPVYYDPPSRSQTVDFEPKFVTRASYISVADSTLEQPQEENLFVNEIEHTDNYATPYFPPTVKPLPRGTRKSIMVMRWMQFTLRILQLMGALGLITCVVTIRGTSDSQGWILRIPPACDTLLAAYSCIHLVRHPRSRTPTSSASYHFFSCFIDAGLIPFYVFASLFAQANFAEVSGENERWRSFFTAPGATDILLFATWMIATIVGGLHLFSIFFDIYLIVLFKKIARMPSNMNPFGEEYEEKAVANHKHKTSDNTPANRPMSEKRIASMSGSTLRLSSPSRLSLAQNPLIPDASLMPSWRPDSTLYSSDSAMQSKTGFYQQPGSERDSRIDMASPNYSRAGSRSNSRPGTSRYSSQHGSFIADLHDPMPEHFTNPASFMSPHSESNSRIGSPAPQSATTNAMAEEQQRQRLLANKWYMDSDRAAEASNSVRGRALAIDQQHHRLAAQASAETLPQPAMPARSDRRGGYLADDEDASDEDDEYNDAADGHAPVADTADDAVSTDIGRALTMGSSIYSDTKTPSIDVPAVPLPTVPATAAETTAPESAPAPAPTVTPRGSLSKTRYYGALNTAAAAAAAGNGGYDSTAVETVPAVPARDANRVVSSTGADVADMSVMYFGGAGQRKGDKKGNGAKRRNVSGKAAEEGRSGWSLWKREVGAAA